MSFANPLFFLLFIPLILFFIFRLKEKKSSSSKLIVSLKEINETSKKIFFTPNRVKNIIRFATLSVLIIALARPQKSFTNEKKKIEAVDIIIAFDLSKSMDALDFKPDRRTVALETISQFIDQRKNDRIGLVLFSGDAYMAVPITNDHSYLKKSLIDSNSNNLRDGTAIGQALAVAVNHIKESKAKSRIVILLTDGDNNMGSVNPKTAADLAKGFGVKVYTVGIGKKGRVKYPIKTRDPFGNVHIIHNYLTDALDEELLEHIAKNTNGQFFRATEKDVLKKIFNTIDKLEKTKIETSKITRLSEKAWPWIFITILLLMIEIILLNTKWRKFP